MRTMAIISLWRSPLFFVFSMCSMPRCINRTAQKKRRGKRSEALSSIPLLHLTIQPLFAWPCLTHDDKGVVPKVIQLEVGVQFLVDAHQQMLSFRSGTRLPVVRPGRAGEVGCPNPALPG